MIPGPDADPAAGDMVMHRQSGHFGELLQGRLGAAGPVVLVTLPCAALSLTLARHPGAFALEPGAEAAIRPGQLQRLFALLGRTPRDRWRLCCHMPVGAGAGASTAALLAFIAHLAPDLSPLAASRLALQIEGASDPLAFAAPERLLWASRRAEVLGRFAALPPLRVVGGFCGPGQRTRAEDERFPEIGDLLAAWPAALADPAALGRLVSENSRRSMEMRGQPGFADLADLAARHGALGISIAHTGSARGFLLPIGVDPAALLAELAHAGWNNLQNFLIGGPDDLPSTDPCPPDRFPI